ncbi:MAG: SMP-30/gluconolactonase/LRE family protein [Clostridia bacterium]|nr:SMP-30/gluconolactonase/LRE family protein [Clostridia bacterium]MBQ6894171.1 SMP-30/gluconolactonase/LRE family protein [Clostridia bacterium]
MSEDVRLFADCHCELSESPMWNEKDKMLYWRGFHGELYRKRINNDVNDFECFQLNIGNIGSMVFTDSDYILLFADGGKIWKWKPYLEPILYKNFQKTLFNDVIADPKGRVYCGMLAENFFDRKRRGEYGSLWMLDNDRNLICLENDTGTVPNGIRFSPELDKLYFGVTDHDCVYVYDYEAETGKISNRKVFATNCCPDGMAMDVNGNLWVACCQPGRPLLCYNPHGELTCEIYFPVHRIISVAFGGEDKSLMFVTTAHENQPEGDHDGGVFVVENTAVGADEFVLKGM